MEQKEHYSESLRLGMLLAITGGFLDAYTYLCRGKVFANAQTGNMVMLGISFMERNYIDAFKYFSPIVAFTVGIFLAEYIKGKLKKNHKVHWRQAVLTVEIILLFLVAFIKSDYVANIMISLICAMQVEAFRKFHGNAYATTMCTGNLRSGTEKLVLFIKNKNKDNLKIAMQYYSVIIIFCFGAFVGGYVTLIFHIRAVLCAIIPLIIALFIMNLDYNSKNIFNR